MTDPLTATEVLYSAATELSALKLHPDAWMAPLVSPLADLLADEADWCSKSVAVWKDEAPSDDPEVMAGQVFANPLAVARAVLAMTS